MQILCGYNTNITPKTIKMENLNGHWIVSAITDTNVNTITKIIGKTLS